LTIIVFLFKKHKVIIMKKLFILFLLIGSILSCENPSTEIQDIVVIGGGLMGSSTAWQLSDQNQSVLLLEKQDFNYNQGSSYGEARIARSNNRGNDMWSYLHNSSVDKTQRLIDFLNADNRASTFKMEDIYTTSPVTYVGRTSIYDKLMASLVRQEVDYKIASTPKEGLELFDVLLPEDVLIQREYNKHSGTVNPRVLILYLHKAIIRKNNEVRYNQQVHSIKKVEDYYELSVKDLITKKEYSIKAKRIVSATGPYSGKLLKHVAPYFDSLINPQRVFLSFMKVKEEKYHSLTNDQKEILKNAYPVINSSTGTRDGSFFSMIEYYKDEMPIIKIGGHFQRSEIENLDEIWAKELSAEEISWSKESMLRYFTLLKLPISKDDMEIVDGYSCVYSLSKTEVPYVSPLPNEDAKPNLDFIVLAGMSGVGAKGAMSYGFIAANLMMNTAPSDDPKYQEVVDALGFKRLIEELK